jgi:hypothetical protein
VRFHALSMRMGLVELLKLRGTAPRLMRSRRFVMAKVIEFRIPMNFWKPSKLVPQRQFGKIIEFCSQTKTSA